jgi:hypothetical protein
MLESMAGQAKPLSQGRATRTLILSVSIPAPFALVTLAERGVRAEKDARESLTIAYRRFLKEQEPSRKEEAGKDLIRAIFGKDAIAEDPFL